MNCEHVRCKLLYKGIAVILRPLEGSVTLDEVHYESFPGSPYFPQRDIYMGRSDCAQGPTFG